METSKAAIVTWCQEYLAGLLRIPAEAVNPHADFDRLGVDSALAVSLLMELEERYDVELPTETLFAEPTLNAVAEYLHTRVERNVT